MGPFLSVLRDTGGKLSVEELIRPGGNWVFTRNFQPAPNFGYSRDVFWVRFRLRSDEPEAIRPIVELQTSRIGDLTWYVVRGGQVVEREAAGMFQLNGARRIDSRLPALGVALVPGEEVEIFMRAMTPASVSFPMVLYPSFESYMRATLRREITISLVAGIALCIFILSLFLGPILGNSLFYLNAGVVVMNFAQMAIFMGYWTWHRLPMAEWVVLQPMLSVGYIGLAMVNLFTWKALGQDFQVSRPGRFQRAFAVFLLGLSVVAVLLPFPVVVRWNNNWAPISLIICLGMTVWWYRSHRHWGTRLMVMVWSVDVVLDILLILEWEGIMPVLISPAALLLAMNSLPPLLFLAVAVDSVHRWMQEVARAQRLESLLTSTRLRMLRYQVNPHFLFNCLNSLIGLIQQNPARASNFVIRLSRFLRISLRTASSGKTKLSEELDAVRAFLEIEEVRFEHQLAVRYEIEAETLVVQVPELILQVVVENAIRHGTSDNSKPLEVVVRSFNSNGSLRLEVVNQGRLRGCSSTLGTGHGIGLTNLRERIALMAPGIARFELLEIDAGTRVLARLELPWDVASNALDESGLGNDGSLDGVVQNRQDTAVDKRGP
jgi:hypothetical protein